MVESEEKDELWQMYLELTTDERKKDFESEAGSELTSELGSEKNELVPFIKKLVIQKINKPSEIAKRMAEEFNLPITVAEQKLEEIVKGDRTLQYISVVTKGRIGRIFAPGTPIPRERRISYHWEREPENKQQYWMRRRAYQRSL